jgi:hypothetical protein
MSNRCDHRDKHKNCEKLNRQNVKRQCVDKSHVKSIFAETVDVSGPNGGVLNVDTVNTDQIFIDNKLFPTSIIPYKINGPSTFVGSHSPIPPPCSACNITCPSPTPGTPSSGLFALGQSFKGKVTFCGIQGMQLNLAGLTLENDDDFALEFINCNQVYVFGGTVKSKNNTAIHVVCSANVTFKSINTTNSNGAMSVESSYDIKIANWYMDNITGFAFDIQCSDYLRCSGLDINNIGSYTSDSLFSVNNCQMIFINNCTFYNINYTSTSLNPKSIIKVENGFDVKISHISILTTSFVSNEDLNVYLVHFKDSGSLILGSFIIDGDSVTVSGPHSATMNCLRLENCNNTFMAHHLMTDNYVKGDANAVSLIFHGVSLHTMTTFTMNSSKICTNYVQGGGAGTTVEVRSFYGGNMPPLPPPSPVPTSGNWYLSGNICNQNFIETSSYITNSSIYGFEVVDVEYTVLFRNCSANNHNNGPQINVAEGGGFKIRGIKVSNNTQNNIDIINCQANQNCSDGALGKTYGFYCTYSNTKFNSCEAISNQAGRECYGFFLPGLDTTVQYTVSLTGCNANTNLSTNRNAYGLYAGEIDGSLSVTALVVKNCIFNSNGPPIGSSPPNPGYGIYLNKVTAGELINNFMNDNNYGLYMKLCDCNALFSNSAIYNDIGYQINQSTNSNLKKNTSQCNTKGFIDNTTGGNSYNQNCSTSDITPFTITGGGVINLYALDKTTGNYINVSGGPLTVFSNLQS